MSSSAEKANVHFPVIAGGFLPRGAVPGDVAQTVRGCRATSVAAGVWLIEPDQRDLSFTDMLVLFNIAPDGTADGITEIIGPTITYTGGTAPDFCIGSSTDDGEGPAFFDAPLAFEVKRIPRSR